MGVLNAKQSRTDLQVRAMGNMMEGSGQGGQGQSSNLRRVSRGRGGEGGLRWHPGLASNPCPLLPCLRTLGGRLNLSCLSIPFCEGVGQPPASVW